MAILRFDNCCGSWEGTPGPFVSSLLRDIGDVGSAQTINARANKYALKLTNYSNWYGVGVLYEDAADAWHWTTVDVHLTDEPNPTCEWALLGSGRASQSTTYLAVGWVRDAEGFRVRLWKFNYDANLAPQNWTAVAEGNIKYVWNARHTISVRYRHNTAADTVDCAAFVDGSTTPAFSISGITKIAGDLIFKCVKGWGITQAEILAGKGGLNWIAYYGNFIWRSEAGTGTYSGSVNLSDSHVVVMHQMYADTNEAARNDFLKGGSVPSGGDPPLTGKYHRVDDNKGSDNPAGNDYVYVGQSLTDEQAFALKDSEGISRDINHIAIVAEVRDTDGIGRAAWLDAAPIAATGGDEWDTTKFDAAMACFKRNTLLAGQDMHILQPYVLALGSALTNPADNDGVNHADESPTGGIGTYQASAGTPHTWCYYRLFAAPPAGAPPAARRIFVTGYA